jgi:hypothetical protein
MTLLLALFAIDAVVSMTRRRRPALGKALALKGL